MNASLAGRLLLTADRIDADYPNLGGRIVSDELRQAAAILTHTLTDEDIERLVRASIDRQPNGCCGNDAWRGHLCQYHEGYEDGLNKAQELLDDLDVVRANERKAEEDRLQARCDTSDSGVE